MFRFAFIMNVEGVTPEEYYGVYENESSRSIVAGVDGMDAAKEYVRRLAADGIDMIDLCGDFDDDITAELRGIAGSDVTIRHARYSEVEAAKLEKLETLMNYGVVIRMKGTGKPYTMELACDSCNAKVTFVKDIEDACSAAQELAGDGWADFMELCSWFDTAKYEAVIKSIGGSIPVGTCSEN